MILTVTMNPSIDVSYPLTHLQINDVNRTAKVSKSAGGKGLNVARVIHLLNHPVTTTGVLGGDFGHFIEQHLDADKIDHKFAHISQESRQCIAILHDGGNQTEILEAGPILSNADGQGFLNHFADLLAQVDLVTISGSLPRGLGNDFYARMLKLSAEKDTPVILDVSGSPLAVSLAGTAKPIAIKPNETELAALLHSPVDKHNLPQLKTLLQDPLFTGIEWVMVSLGAAGALVKHQDHFYHAAIPKIHVVNPVGSGDATIGGLAIALASHQEPSEVMKTAMTCGMLNTIEAKTGFVEPALFDEYYSKVQIKSL